MNKFYGAHDQWTDLDKQNDVLITSTDGVIDSVKVNGEDYGGGGSSDFSTAEVTINIQGVEYPLIAIVDDVIKEMTVTETGTYTVPLYKGVVIQPLPPENLSEPPAFTGDIELSIEDFGVKVTGDGSITLVGSVS